MKHWKTHEIKLAHKLRADGLTYRAIAAHIPGRSEHAVSHVINSGSRPREIIRAERIARRQAYAKRYGVPIGNRDHQPDEVMAPRLNESEVFRIHLLTAIDRFANDNGTDIDTAARFLLSGVAFG
jgi:hypothetical protein